MRRGKQAPLSLGPTCRRHFRISLTAHDGQECWDARARSLLRSKLRACYAHCYSPADRAKCGLMVFSKDRPLHGGVFYRFQSATGAERHLFDKGCCGVFVILDGMGGASPGSDPGSEPQHTPPVALAIVNTHTQSDYWGNSARCVCVIA